MNNTIEFFRSILLEIIQDKLSRHNYVLKKELGNLEGKNTDNNYHNNDVLKSLESKPIILWNTIKLKGFNVQITLEHKDITTNIAMVLASKLSQTPKQIALDLIPHITKLPYVKEVDFVDPGFINIGIENQYWHKQLLEILSQGSKYGINNLGKKARINLEFVSANPTGPLHIGHMRNAIYGDVLANMLKSCGYAVTKEFYVNDLGMQIEKLIESVYLRYQEALGYPITQIPEGMYPGEYLINVAKHIIKLDGDKWLQKDKELYSPYFKEVTIEYLLKEIKQDLQSIGIKHDIFTTESSLHKEPKLLDYAIKTLEKHDLIYTGKLDDPISRNVKQWNTSNQEQLLVKVTKIGGDRDCALYKSNGEWSYFASDLAYIYSKFRRNYQLAIYVLGSEQQDYVKRLEKLSYYITDNKMKIKGFLYQMVGLIKDNKPLKLSKRSGNLLIVSEIIQELDKDTLRFMMLTHKNDMPIKLDVNKLQLQNKDNPVFYVKYAYARAKSLFKIACNCFPNFKIENLTLLELNLHLLNLPEELNLIKYMAQWPQVLRSATSCLDPQRLTLFLYGVASLFHGLWTKGKNDSYYKFVVKNDYNLTTAKLSLAQGVINIIESCAQIIAIDLKDSM